jgi:hypothetical protein
MLVEHRGKRPTVHESAWIAPAAVSVGDVHVVVMEHALVRGRAAHPVTVGDDVLIGPQARAEVRVGGVVHADGEVVPIGWVGDRVLPHDRHDDIWAIQEGLDFPGTVYGEPRGDDLMARVMPRQTAWLGAHRDDRVL